MLYYDRLAAPRSRNMHSRAPTNPNLPSPQATPTGKSIRTLNLTSLQSTKPAIVSPRNFSLASSANHKNLASPIAFRPRIQSVATVQMTTSPKSPMRIVSRPQTTKNAGQRKSFNNFNNIIDRNGPQQRFSMAVPVSKEEEKIEEEKSPRSPGRGARVSIFETYKDPQLMTASSVFEKERMERKFKAMQHRRREKGKLIGSFDKFFVKCDLEAVVQNDETKQIIEQLRKFGEDYRRMQGQAGKNVERFNLHSSDARFNQMREKIRFKKKIIEHLMGKVRDKQDLLSMYYKQVSMEENVNRSRMVLQDDNA